MDVPAPVAGTVSRDPREGRRPVSRRASLLLDRSTAGDDGDAGERQAGGPDGRRATRPSGRARTPSLHAATAAGARARARRSAAAGRRRREPAPSDRPTGNGPVYASPSVRRLARELGVALAEVAAAAARAGSPPRMSAISPAARTGRAGAGSSGAPVSPGLRSRRGRRSTSRSSGRSSGSRARGSRRSRRRTSRATG